MSGLGLNVKVDNAALRFFRLCHTSSRSIEAISARSARSGVSAAMGPQGGKRETGELSYFDKVASEDALAGVYKSKRTEPLYHSRCLPKRLQAPRCITNEVDLWEFANPKGPLEIDGRGISYRNAQRL